MNIAFRMTLFLIMYTIVFQCFTKKKYINHHKQENVKSAHVSGNLDAPEGGFDAIMQAVVCKKEIGWRDQARRLLVFSTDAGFHYAGDGKLGGVITPNDGECHMRNNEYTHSTIQDYPSISQINLKVKQNAINIIFAVTKSQHSVYEKLSKHIEGSSSAVLSEDSSNVVDVVRDEYNVSPRSELIFEDFLFFIISFLDKIFF